jgi:kexin
LVNPEDSDWDTTAAGRHFSYKYGYGKIDAYDYVTAAKTWQNVKPQAWFDTPAIQIAGGTMNTHNEMSGGELIVPGGVGSSTIVTQSMLDVANFEKLEHINVKVWISHTRRGDVEVEVVSPGGIKSMLAAPRKSDSANSGYPGWTFMSVKHW